MFVGYNDYTLRAWDTLKVQYNMFIYLSSSSHPFILQETHLGMWIGHQDRLSHVQMSPDGMALCTSSWDGTLAVSSCVNKLGTLLPFAVIRYGHNI